MKKFTKGQTVEYFTNGNYVKGNVTKLRPFCIETWMGILKVSNKSLLRTCYLLLLLPTFATAQINGTIQKTVATETIRGTFGSNGIDSLSLLRNGNLGLFLQAPVGLAATGSTTGGTLAAGTYFYKVTGIDFYGQTKGSAEVSATTTGTTSSVALTWTALTGATSYRVYRGTTSGVQNVYYTSATNSYTDINAASTAGTVPLVTTAYIVRLNTDGSVRGQSFIKPGGLSTQFLKADGSVDVSTYLTSLTGVNTFSAGTTGLTPSSATSGAITLAGTLAIANGGTGSATQNFVDLTTNQTVGGNKAFSGTIAASDIGGNNYLFNNNNINTVGTSAGNKPANIYSYGLNLSGSTSGMISILGQAAAGTYNFNLPTTAGTSGQVLTSGGGVGAPMTWTTATSGVTTMAAIGAAPNANGASISGSTLTLQPAAAGFGGVLTNAAQTIDGAKTLTLDAVVNGVTIGKGTASVATNTAVGTSALASTTTGDYNTALGANALLQSTSGYSNTALGARSLIANTTGFMNTAVGRGSLENETTGNRNTVVGHESGQGITTGSGNTIIGASVGGLATGLTNNIILASGVGAIKAQHNGTDWTFTGNVNTGAFIRGSNDGTFLGTTTHELRTNSAALIAQFSNSNATDPYGINVSHGGVTKNNATNYLYQGVDGTTPRFIVMTNGGIHNYSANNVNLSDRTTKKNISLASSHWNKIKAIEIDNYQYTEAKPTDVRYLLGVMAQQVETVEPLWVSQEAFKMPDGTVKKGVYETQLMYATMKALQEAMARIESLETRVKVLELNLKP